MNRFTPEIHTIEADHFSVVSRRMDCIEALGDPTLVQRGSIDVVVTSPPYNLGISYSTYDDTMPRDKYLDWLGKWAGLVSTAMSENGSLFLNIAGKPTDPEVPFRVLGVMLEAGFVLQNVIHWVKSIAIEKSRVGDYPAVTGDIVVGHYKPINSQRFINDCHEYVFHLTKTGAVPLERLAIGVPYQDKSNVRRWNGSGRDLHCRGNTWFIPYKTISNGNAHRPHPATFPAELPEMCLRLHGVDRARHVLDPFQGLGSSGVACCRLGLNYLGIEIDEEYHVQAVRNITAACAGRAQVDH